MVHHIGITKIVLSCCIFFASKRNFVDGTKISPPVIELQCTSKVVSIALKSDADFKGVVYVGDQSRDCRMLGKGTQKLEISLPVKQCGIVTVKSDEDSSKVVHKLMIYLQLHPLVQQLTDIRIMQNCTAPISGTGYTSAAMADGTIFDSNQQKVQIVAPTWMEMIRGGRQDGRKISGPVKVGETIGIIVKANVNAGQDSLVTNCHASDGTSSVPEMFVNENGCPVDPSVVPGFIRIQDGSDASIQTHWTKFPAFKFPDRTRLYLQCEVQICDSVCSKPQCIRSTPIGYPAHSRKVRQDSSATDNWRQARVVDRVDVVNSVRVFNPDSVDGNDAIAMEEVDGPKKVCWPLKGLMTAIGILAAIFLICILIALCFWWTRRQRKNRQFDSSYGTQSNASYVNPSTNYYSMHQYPDSQQHSAKSHSEFEPEYAPASGHPSHASQSHMEQQRRFRDQSF